jgi:hypothetical protein
MKISLTPPSPPPTSDRAEAVTERAQRRITLFEDRGEAGGAIGPRQGRCVEDRARAVGENRSCADAFLGLSIRLPGAERDTG